MEFPSTIWTVIRKAKDDPKGARELVIRRYWEPILQYARMKGLASDDAEDLTQNVFLHVSKEGFLEQADRAKGRFRSLLIAVTDNVLNMWWRHQYAEKRDGRRQVLLDDERLREIAATSGTTVVDAEFNRTWAQNIIRHALDRLRVESERLGTPYAAAVEAHYLRGRSYQDIATDLQSTPAQIRNYIFRGKALLGDFIRDFIREYCGSQEEFDEELRDLQQFLGTIG